MTARLSLDCSVPAACEDSVEDLELPEWAEPWEFFKVKAAKSFLKNKENAFSGKPTLGFLESYKPG